MTKEQVVKYRDCIEWHEPIKDKAGDTTREGWYSFTLECMQNGGTPEYNKLSDIMRGSDLDENTRYTFTAEVLDAMLEIMDNEQDITDDDLIMEYADSATPIYNYDVMEWCKDNYSTVEEYIDSVGWDGAGKSIITATMGAYCEAWNNYYHTVLEAIK